MAKPAKEFKHQAKQFVPAIRYKEGAKLLIDVKYYGNWHNKDGTIKRKDGQNLDKCLYDAIFEKMMVDDKVAFKGVWEKIQSDKDCTKIKISEYK